MSLDLGMVTAYSYAVAGGYTGTQQEFEELLGNIAIDLEEIENLSVTVTTLPAGSQATASYNNGVLALGIPKGDKGDTGATGATGPTGPTGNGIQSIAKTGTVGNVDTYTITYTNGQTTTFTVTNGSVTSVDGKTGDVTLDDKANIDGYYEDLTAGSAEELISNVGVIDTEAYNFRPAGGSAEIGNRAYNTWVGGSLAVNQLAGNTFRPTQTTDGITYTPNANGTFMLNGTATRDDWWACTPYPNTNTSIVGHKYYIAEGNKQGVENSYGLGFGSGTLVAYGDKASIINASGTGQTITYIYKNGATINNATFKPVLIDLTLLFGSTIADYIYNLEQGQAGAGVAWFKQYFPKDYYPYNAGGLEHVTIEEYKTNELNQWDEEWEVGGLNTSTGANWNTSDRIRSKNYVQILPSTSYYFTYPTSGVAMDTCFYDDNKQFISSVSSVNTAVTTPANAHFLRFATYAQYGTTYNNDICISLYYDDEYAGVYEPYKEHVYPLDDSIVLRGIPIKTEENRLAFDGDTWEDNGTITRRYGIVDLGTASYVKTDYTNNRTLFSIVDFVTNQGAKPAPSYASGASLICSKFVSVSQSATWVKGDMCLMYQTGIAQAGTLLFVTATGDYADATTFKTAMSGVYLVYELATPTTEQAPSFTSPQIVHNIGTEELVGSSIPVGHNTKYLMNIKAMVEASPQSPTTDGDYIMRRQSGQNMYVALASTSTIQDIISRLEALEA